MAGCVVGKRSNRSWRKATPTTRRCSVGKVDWVEPICLECDRRAKLVSGLLAYPHRPERARDMFWMCECGAIVSCHPGTAIANGRPANAQTCEWRHRAHQAFDAIWRARGTPGSRTAARAREAAYRWLAEQLGIPRAAAHMGRFNAETCKRVVQLCRGAPNEG
jgi:hypothetical protein